jgi:hypothetical protein
VLDLKLPQNKWQRLWTFISFFNREFISKVAEDTNSYVEQFLRKRELSNKSPARARKPVTWGRNLCCTGPLHAYGHYSETYSEIIFHLKKGNFHTKIWS